MSQLGLVSVSFLLEARNPQKATFQGPLIYKEKLQRWNSVSRNHHYFYYDLIVVHPVNKNPPFVCWIILLYLHSNILIIFNHHSAH